MSAFRQPSVPQRNSLVDPQQTYDPPQSCRHVTSAANLADAMRIPVGRLDRAEEAARVVLMILGKKAYMTGHTVQVNGGLESESHNLQLSASSLPRAL